MTGLRRISTTRAFRKLQSECTSGVVSLPSRVRCVDEFGYPWGTTDGASIIISSSLLLQELSQSQLRWLLQWISCAKFLELVLDLTSLHGQLLLAPSQLLWSPLTWQETTILNALSRSRVQSLV